MTQEEFLERYNPNRTVETALSKSINAAVQRNRLYNNVPNNRRQIIRYFWGERLLELVEKFSHHMCSEIEYENEIIALKTIMNREYEDSIDFRISHSQKSISVFFKHLWCMNRLGTPPQCPVDRIILTRARAQYNARGWGFVNDIETHREKIILIQDAAEEDNFESIAEWELFNFN